MEILESFVVGKDLIVDFIKTYWFHLIALTILLLALPWGRRVWIKVLHIMMFFQSLHLAIFPKHVCDFMMDGTPDELHIQLTRGLGMILLFQVISFWMMSKSSDSTVATSVFWAYTIQCGINVLAQGYVLTHIPKKGNKFDAQVMQSGFMLSILLLAVNLYYILRSQDWAGYGEMLSHKNFHLRLDFVCLFVIGVFCYAFPAWCIKLETEKSDLDTVHVYLMRGIGACIMNSAIMSGRASNFLRENDKDTLVLSHLMFYLTCFIFVLLNILTHLDQYTWKRVFINLIDDTCLIVNAVGALGINPVCIKKILIPKVKQIPGDIQHMIKTRRL